MERDLNMNLLTRKANINDIEKGLLELFIEGYKHHLKGRPDIFLNLSNEELKEELTNQFDETNIIIISDEEKIVGFISYKIKQKNKKKLLYVKELVIKESYRNKGLASKLMNEMNLIAKKEKCSRIELNCWSFNKNALEMYEHLGYKKQRVIYELEI